MDEPRVTPVAVIGLACRLPGGIDSPELLWEALLRGDDMITVIPLDRWDADEFYDPEPGVPGRSVCKWGAFIDNHADFDCEFFGISEREAINTDPQQRLLLETSWEAMEHSGLTRTALTGTRTGVFMGVTHNDYIWWLQTPTRWTGRTAFWATTSAWRPGGWLTPWECTGRP